MDVEDAFTAEGFSEWRRGDVCRVLPEGRFLVRVHKPDGEPDPEFKDWYAEIEIISPRLRLTLYLGEVD